MTGKIISHPKNKDYDYDGLWNIDELYMYGTDPFVADTDSDGMDDGTEAENWFDPLEDDYDNDGRPDLMEYQEGTSPYAYDKSWDEHLADFRDGFFGGEFIEDTDSIPCMLGKITSGFTPVGNVRDMVADIIQGDWIDAGVNFAGILIDAADAAKTSGKIGKFLLNNADNSALYAEILSFVNKNFPDALKYLGKDENFVKATKKISLNKEDKITKKQHDELKEIFDKMGLDDLLDGEDDNQLVHVYRGTNLAAETEAYIP